MSQYPSIEKVIYDFEHTRSKDEILIETRRSWRSILSSMLLFFVATLAIVLVNVFLPSASLIGYFTAKYHISTRWLAVIPAVLFLEVIRKYHDDLYQFTSHHLTHFDGRLSLSYSVPNIRYVDIRAVIVYQDIWGRLLDYGDLQVDTAAQEKSEMILTGIRAPQELAEIIEALRTRSRKSFNPDAAKEGYQTISED